MGRSFVQFKEHGYWTRDQYLEGLLFMLVREVKKMDPMEVWHIKVIDEWTNAATSGYSGCVPSTLDELFDTEDKKKTLKQLLKTVIHGLRTNPTFLTVEELNQNNVGTGGWIKVPATFFERAGQLMLQLLNGELKIKVETPITYWNDLEQE